MEMTRSHQGASRMAQFAQLFTRYPVVIGFLLMFTLTWPLGLGLIAMGLRCVAALVVVIVAGPNLGWQPAAQLEATSPAVAAC